VIDAAANVDEAVWALTRLGTEAFFRHPRFRGIDTGAAVPFSRLQARSITRRRLDPAQRASLQHDLAEATRACADLEGALASPDRIDAQVIEQLEPLRERAGHDPRRTTIG